MATSKRDLVAEMSGTTLRYGYERQLYPVATSGDEVMFFDVGFWNRKPDQRPMNVSDIAIATTSGIIDGSFMAHVTRPHSFKPIAGNPLAKFIFSFARGKDPSGSDWEKVFQLGNGKVLLKYVKDVTQDWQAPGSMAEADFQWDRYGVRKPKNWRKKPRVIERREKYNGRGI